MVPYELGSVDVRRFRPINVGAAGKESREKDSRTILVWLFSFYGTHHLLSCHSRHVIGIGK